MREVTAIQAAALTGLSERTIRRRIATGELPARRIAPNRFAININDLPRPAAHDHNDARLYALEQRVTELEAQQQSLLRALGGSTPSAHIPEVETTADDIERLDDLLLQLASAIERLSPRYLPQTDTRRDPRVGRRVQ